MKDIIKQYLIKKLAKQDYCSYQLKDSLIKKFGSEHVDIIDKLIQEYQNKGIINNEEYMHNYILHKIKSYHGKYYIAYKLRKIGYKVINFDQYIELEKIYKNKYIQNHSSMDKNKLMNRLASRGYEYKNGGFTDD